MSSLMTVESGVVHASIVEAIVDIDCDLPPATNVLDLEERAKERLRVEYPEVRRVTDGVTALQLMTADGKQIVQFRAEGYSFNLLERYDGARANLPEIEKTWGIFRDLAAPVQIRAVALRRIDRFLVSGGIGAFDHVPYYSAVDAATGYRANATMAVQLADGRGLVVISAVESSDSSTCAPEDWRGIQEAILSLDRLTSRVFEDTVIRTWLNPL
jgi:hypothetical protein